MPKTKSKNNPHKKASNPFDKVLPDTLKPAAVGANCISYLRSSGVTDVITLGRKNKYHSILLVALNSGLNSDWFTELADTTRDTYFGDIRHFILWINETKYKATSQTRYEILKDYESYRMNDCGVKNTPLTNIRNALAEGAAHKALSSSDYDYLQMLLRVSKPKPTLNRTPSTLSSWFDVPWLRSIVGESAYLQLESPLLLFNSFRATIAATLNYLLEQREQKQQFKAVRNNSSETQSQHHWNISALDRFGTFDEKGEPANDLSELLLLDLVFPHSHNAMKTRLAHFGTHKLPRYFKSSTSNKTNPWRRPVLFRPEYQKYYSPLEEMLCGWLIACLSVQPSDIRKLKVGNFAREYNRSGRLTAIQCNYYKGRCGSFQKTEILMGDNIAAQALDRYMKGPVDKFLFRTDINQQRHLVFTSSDNNAINLLIKIWKQSSFQTHLDSELQSSKTGRLFIDSFLALENGDAYYHSDYSRKKESIAAYRATVERPFPVNIFQCTHIKNTSVHAKSDIYREADLINHNSHTSITEKDNYLTDANKEWINQSGRITRLVLHDLQNVVFNPSITAMEQSVKDQNLRTRIMDTTESTDITTHSLRSNHLSSTNDDEILVLDTVDTALYFIHYLAQAELAIKNLVNARPDWVEQTLIVQVEWTAQTLARMKSAATAKKDYPKYAAHLPPLFEHLLETIE